MHAYIDIPTYTHAYIYTHTYLRSVQVLDSPPTGIRHPRVVFLPLLLACLPQISANTGTSTSTSCTNYFGMYVCLCVCIYFCFYLYKFI